MIDFICMLRWHDGKMSMKMNMKMNMKMSMVLVPLCKLLNTVLQTIPCASAYS